MTLKRSRFVVAGMAVLLTAFAVEAAATQDYFQGKSVALYAGFTPGGGVDSEMRLIAQYYSAFVPGKPTVLPLNMPGAGGILLANHLYTIDKPDGLTIGMPGRSGFVLAASTGDPSVHYKLDRFTWIGSSGAQNPILWLRGSLKIRSFAQFESAHRSIVIGGLASTSSSIMVPRIITKYEGLPLRVISGYTGLSEVTLAMERGELDGIYTEAGTFRPDLIESGAVIPVLQTFDIEPNLPSLEKLVVNPKEKGVLNLVVGPSRLGAPVMAPPGVPSAITRVLRSAYLAMEKNAGFRQEAQRRGIELATPVSGSELQAYVSANLSSVSPDVLADYHALLGAR